MTHGSGAPAPRHVSGAGPLDLGAPFGTRYRILRELGAGGMGVVYQAWDAELGVAVALKVVRPEISNDPAISQEVTRRFKRELLLARQVTHKHVVRIHDLGEIDGIKYITMPYIEGRDLAAVIREKGRLPAPEALRIAKQVAAGLTAAHDAGVVHRDLKPENVMIDADGQALIMDFGISRSVTTGPATVTAAGAIMGTLEYMAPEQATGATVDQRADVYSLGLMLHDMLAGRRRIAAAQSALSEMMGRMQQQPPALRTLAPDVPEALERIVSKCLQPVADQRYPTSRALLSDLEALDPDGHLARKPISRDYQWKTATATMLVLLLLAAGTAVWFAKKGGPVAPVAAREPLSILIADFQNTANDPVFDGALEQALGIAMEGAPFVTSYNRQQAKQLAAQMNSATAGTLTEAAARLVAVSQGIKVVLTGAIAQVGSGYKISVKAINPESGAQLQERSASAASKSEVLQSMSAVAGEMRSALGDTTPEDARRQAAETFTAGSLEAMAAYARAQELNASGNPQEALAKFKEALQHDPQFGRAYMNIASIYTNLKQPAAAEENYKTALKYVDRMTEREKYRTLGTYYLGVTRDYAKAIENYQTLVKLYPADNTGTANLALAYVYVRNLPMAAEMGRRAIDIYPKSVLQRTNYATYSMYSGDFETAGRVADAALKDNPKYEWAALTLALSLAALGQDADARAAYERLKGMSDLGSSLALMGEADLEMYYGRTGTARAILKEGIARDERSNDYSTYLALKLVALAELELAAGRKAESLGAADRAVTLAQHEAVLVPAAGIFIAAGQPDRARDIVRNLEQLIPPHMRSYAHVISAQIALNRGRVPEAIDELRAALKLHDSWFAHVVLAEAYAAAGSHVEARSEWEACLKRRGEATDVFFADTSSLRYLPPIYYRLARAQEATGAVTEARASYESFLKIRGAAEPADPLAADALKRLKPAS